MRMKLHALYVLRKYEKKNIQKGQYNLPGFCIM